MPSFRYSTPNGAVESHAAALIEAPDRATAIRILLARGETPTRIEELDSPANASQTRVESSVSAFPFRVHRASMARGQLAPFVRELATAVNAGLPLVQSLKTIARQDRASARAAVLDRLIDSVEHGRPLSEAMRTEGRPFTELVINLVHAGEVSGRLGEVLAQAANLLDRDLKLKRAVLGALLYPAIIAGAVSIAVVIVVTIIVPRVLAAVAGQLKTLPFPTRIVQGVAGFVGSWWWLLLLAGAGMAWWCWRLYSQPATRLRVDGALLRIPVVGTVIRDAAVARFTRTFGTLVAAGLPVLMSLRITKGTLGNAALQSAIDGVCEQVQAGRTIAEPLERSGLFPSLLVQIVGLGEQTGRLDEVLNQAAESLEDRTEQSLKVFTTVLPPALIIVLAGLVGFVVLSILLPLIELQESIG